MRGDVGPFAVSCAALFGAVACTGQITAGNGGGGCEETGNAPPAAPVLMEPVAGRIDVIPAGLVIRTSAFTDGDVADTHAASEFEIWRVSKGGQPAWRVWSAHVTDPARLTSVTLADGAFEGSAAAGGLGEWEDYVVRARHRDSSGACRDWSDWSADRKFRTDDGSTFLFDETKVHSVYLTIPPESWSAIHAEALPPGCVPHQRNYYRGDARFVAEGSTEEVVFQGVGIKVKGGCGSARDLNGKAGFKVNLDWDDPAVPGCPTGRRLMGQKHLTLNNQVQDRSSEREMLAYRFYKAMNVPVPTPRVAHIRVYVNDQYWGLYLHVETVDRRFLARWFESKEGMLYEGTYWCDLVPENVPSTEDDTHCLTREFSPDACDAPEPGADPQDYTLLRQVVGRIAGMPSGGWYPEVLTFWNYDAFLSQWAVESVIAHWDAYEFDIMNNYRVYHDPVTDLWTMIPHGVDQTFSGEIDPWGVSGVVARRCLDEPECEAAFGMRLREATDTFEALGLASYAQTIHDRIRPHVQEDPRREYSMSTWENQHDELLSWIAQRPARMRQILQARGF